jgi:D-alanyl-D-alanine dipeptidase
MKSIIEYITESKNITSNLVDLKTYPFKLDYTEVKRFNKKNPKILLNKKAADALVKAQNDLPKGYKFIINYGYRSYEEQYLINEYMKKRFKKEYPNEWEEKLNIYTGGDDYLEYIKNTPIDKITHMSHFGGNAVDIPGILDNNKKPLNFGVQENNSKDRIDYYKTGEIADNRNLLKHVLSKNGFENLKDEWWHWGYYK